MAGSVYYVPHDTACSRLTPAYCCAACGAFVHLEHWDDHLAHHRLVNRLKEVATELWRVVRPDQKTEPPEEAP